MSNTKISVQKQKHIAMAGRDAYDCPVALAIKDVVNDGVRVGVTHDYCNIRHEEQSPIFGVKIGFPSNVTEAIAKYDKSGKMQPFVFELDIPDQYLPSK